MNQPDESNLVADSRPAASTGTIGRAGRPLESRLDAKSFAIGILAVTASVLFVGLMLVSQRPAQAIGMNDRGGDYIMLTQQFSNTTEALIVVDAAARHMIAYVFDYNTKNLEILRKVPLDQLPKPQDQAQQPVRRRR